MKHSLFSFLLAVAGVMALAAHASATPLGTAFTYQGLFKDGGPPATGTYHLRFQLWNALVGGSQVGTDVNFPTVSISDGWFTVQLDFGANVFDGSSRWLQVQVITNGGATITTLTPRQPITATPFALYALNSDGPWAISGTSTYYNDGNVGIGTASPSAPQHIAREGVPFMLLQDTGAASTQTGYIDFRNDSMVETAWMGFGLEGSPDFSIVNARPGGDIILNPFTGNVGIGTTAPGVRLHVVASGNAIFGVDTSQGGSSALFGNSSNGVGVTGYGKHGVTGTGVAGVGVLGGGTTYDFNAVGAGVNYGATSSIRWKRNIKLIDNPLGKLADLRGVYFDWDAEHGGQHDVGMIAEEVGAVLPEIVNYEENGIDANGMDYSKLAPLLAEGVKALKAENDAQQDRLDALEAENAALRAANANLAERLDALEAMVVQLANRKNGDSQ